MGFSGHLVFGRSKGPLLETAAFDGMHPEVRETVHACWPRPGGWQTLQLDFGLWDEAALRALVACTGQPACAADVYDSDAALVTGLAPDGRTWRAWLNLATAAELAAEASGDLADGYDEAVRRRRAEFDAAVPAAAEGALRWAAAAGAAGAAGQPAIEDLLRSQQTFAEDLFHDLLDGLGFPAAVEP